MKFNEKQNQTSFRVGLFVIVSLVILVSGYLWLTNYLEKGDLTQFTIAFPEVSGLELGDGVLILGINSGKVTDISLKGSKVLVSVSVKLQEPLRTGTTFSIKDTSLMGSTRVIIQPGTGSQLLETSQIQQGTFIAGLTSLTSEASKMIQELQQLLSSFNDPDNVFDKYSQAADSLQLFLHNANNFIIKNDENLTTTVTILTQTSQQIADIISRNKDNIDSTISGSNELITNLTHTSDSIRLLSEKINIIAEQIQNKDSTFSELTQDDELYQNLLRSTASLDSLIQNIKKNPKKYLSIKMF
ncbi:MAG: MlaD family protein [Candidatus Stygibacter australis]|nr:MlaD family protein [Candidatus Stygibacter australis]MDP8320865.1 MlaD family protein [Candidatus Stygibacter australis]